MSYDYECEEFSELYQNFIFFKKYTSSSYKIDSQTEVTTFNPCGDSFYGKKKHDEISEIWRKSFMDKNIDWNRILQLEEPMLIVLKFLNILDDLNKNKSSSNFIKDWYDLNLLSDVLISVSKSKLTFHKGSIILKMLSPNVLNIIIDLISETLTTTPSIQQIIVVNKLIIFYEEVILYFDHLLPKVDTSLFKSLLEFYERFYRHASKTADFDNEIFDKLANFIKKVNINDFNSFNLCFPTNINKKSEIYVNLKVGAYKSVADYINTHFVLLKEDFESALRTGIHNYLKTNQYKPKENSLMIFENVSLFITQDDKNYKFQYAVQFMDDQINKLKQVDWLNSQMFMYGSLILLTTNHFKTYFLAKVENRRPLERGRGVLIISFLIVPDGIDFDAKYLLAEPTKYFEPSCSVMKILRLMPKYKFPFEKYLVNAINNVMPPSYLNENTSYKIGDHLVIVSKRDTYPQPESVGLNSYQMDALYHALNNEICLIQGPPGTGKTFMCRQVIKTLLQNKHVWANKHNTPILIICYKNLSLDELLNGLLKDKVNVIRIGRRTKNLTLAKYYSLRAIQKPKYCEIFHNHKNKIVDCKLKVAETRYIYFEIISMITKNMGLIQFAFLKSVLNPEEVEFLKHIYLDWIFDMQVKDMKTSSFTRHSNYEITEEDITVFQNTLKKSPTINNKNKYFNNNGLHLNDLDKLCSCLNNLLNFKLNIGQTKKTELLNSNIKDITNVEDRWALYYFWLEKLKSRCYFFIKKLTEMHCDLDGKDYEILNVINSRKIGQNDVDVIGMTTTAGARLNILLDELKPRIVIIEEAAEIIESHCIASLNEHCQHVILFGDHKQLRPCTDSKELATEYNFDLSLFERLINNGIKPSVLNIQYRMHPKISALIAPAIYKSLQNDDSVMCKGDVKGISKNVFFLNHLHHENKGPKSSIYNDFEVQLALSLAHYFIRQGYNACEITILAMYSEQERMLNEKKKIMLKQNCKISKNLENIIITTVDSYQGKENTIVILSLVRNNKKGQIGFLALENRVCVALSRAKIGLFILGNMTLLANHSKLWQEINIVLQKQNAIGNKLPLICQRKIHKTEAVNCNELLITSSTGCDYLCKKELQCGHMCKSNCHLQDEEHKKIYLCTEFCSAILKCGHKCQFMCHTDDMEHETKYRCLLHNNDSNDELENTILSRLKSFFISPNVEQAIHNSSKLCGARLSCGHKCLFQCQLFKGGHQSTLLCKKNCGKILKCGHKCTYYCHINKRKMLANKHSCSTKCANNP